MPCNSSPSNSAIKNMPTHIHSIIHIHTAMKTVPTHIHWTIHIHKEYLQYFPVLAIRVFDGLMTSCDVADKRSKILLEQVAARFLTLRRQHLQHKPMNEPLYRCSHKWESHQGNLWQMGCSAQLCVFPRARDTILTELNWMKLTQDDQHSTKHAGYFSLSLAVHFKGMLMQCNT